MPFFWKENTTYPMHAGFFEPKNISHWFWPTAGAVVNAFSQFFSKGVELDGDLYVFVMDTYEKNPGPWGTKCLGMLTS